MFKKKLFKLLKLPIPKDINALKKIGCAIQITFKPEDISKLESKSSEIHRILSIKNRISGFNPTFIKLPNPPYFEITANNLNYFSELKVTGQTMWGQVKDTNDIYNAIVSFSSIQEEILKKVKISRIQRIGIVITYRTSKENITFGKRQIRRILGKKVEITPKKLEFEIENWKRHKDFSTNIRFNRKNNGTFDICWDMSYNKILGTDDIGQKCIAMSKAIEGDYKIDNFLKYWK